MSTAASTNNLTPPSVSEVTVVTCDMVLETTSPSSDQEPLPSDTTDDVSPVLLKRVLKDDDASISPKHCPSTTTVLMIATSTLEEKNEAQEEQEEQESLHPRRVSFISADIVEFEPTVWTASVTSGGVPCGMSTTERSRTRRRLDSYENQRHQER